MVVPEPRRSPDPPVPAPRVPPGEGTVAPTRCGLSGARLELLESFLVLAQELHVGRAATRLFLTQSGLSRRLNALEAQLGLVLFERNTRHVQLSPAGAILLPHVEGILLGVRAASLALAAAPQPGRPALDAC